MTHDVLRTDIELATRLRAAERPDDEIIAALVQRGVDPAGAARLVDDLRDGRKAIAQSPVPPEFLLPRRIRTKSGDRGTGPSQPQPAQGANLRRKHSVRSARHHRKRPAAAWRIPAIIVALGVVAGGILIAHRYHAGADSTEEHASKAPRPKVNGANGEAPAAAAPGQHPSPEPLALELRPDGLHIGASHVTPGNILTAVADNLGVATRTNQVGQTDTVIYAYDRQGLLVYSQKGGGTNSIVLDCEANGGTNGATAPFTGTLTIDGQVIRADTDSQTLSAIRQLGLNHPGSDRTIWGGRYNGLELVFAYLKSSQRLSLIEIDLK
ncbi:MAG: hypothetical protein ACLQU3_17920 [Limisphaerales bacterium]